MFLDNINDFMGFFTCNLVSMETVHTKNSLYQQSTSYKHFAVYVCRGPWGYIITCLLTISCAKVCRWMARMLMN